MEDTLEVVGDGDGVLVRMGTFELGEGDDVFIIIGMFEVTEGVGDNALALWTESRTCESHCTSNTACVRVHVCVGVPIIIHMGQYPLD